MTNEELKIKVIYLEKELAEFKENNRKMIDEIKENNKKMVEEFKIENKQVKDSIQTLNDFFGTQKAYGKVVTFIISLILMISAVGNVILNLLKNRP